MLKYFNLKKRQRNKKQKPNSKYVCNNKYLNQWKHLTEYCYLGVIVSIIATTYIKVHQATTKVLNVLLWKIF
jgi:hypothetical protein